MEMSKLDYYEALYQRSPKYLRFYRNTVLPLIFICYISPIAWQLLGKTISDSAFSRLCWTNGIWLFAVIICFCISNYYHMSSWIANLGFCSIFSGTVLVSFINKLIENDGISGFIIQLEGLRDLDSLMTFVITWGIILIMVFGVVTVILALVSHIRHAKLFLSTKSELRRAYEKQENP